MKFKNQTGEMSNQNPKSNNEDRGAAQKTLERWSLPSRNIYTVY